MREMNKMATKSTKYRKYKKGKTKYPTKHFRGQSPLSGAKRAQQAIESEIGRSLKVAKTQHTKFQWVFCELIGESD